jgi:uncharacterized membrane protein
MAEAKKPVEPVVVAGNKDVEENKVYGVLAYIGILFLVPLLVAPKSPFAKFHANQGCVLFIASVALSIVWIIPILGWIVGFVGGVAVLVFAVMGIINAINGKMKKLPLIGDIEIIK